MNYQKQKGEVESYIRMMIRRCQPFNEDKASIYEWWLDWLQLNGDLLADIDELTIEDLCDHLWIVFCEVNNVNPEKARNYTLEDDFPDEDDRESYEEAIESMMNQD